MTATPRKRAVSGAKKPATGVKPPPDPARGARGRKTQPETSGGVVRLTDRETVARAVERALAVVEITPKRAVLAATVRRLAAALDLAEPTDVAKVSKELATRMAELLADARPDEGDDDWTEE